MVVHAADLCVLCSTALETGTNSPGREQRRLFESDCLAGLTLEQGTCDIIVQHKLILRKAAPKN